MMMFPEKKNAARLIISNMKPDFVEKFDDRSPIERLREQEGPDEDYSTALEDAGRKVMAAIERKDVKDFVSYVKELIYLCREDDCETSYDSE